MRKEKMTKQEKQFYKGRLLHELAQHVGQANKIGMGELYFRVFSESWNHRINDTRRLRTLVTELRTEGIAICSVASSSGGGYWLASAGSELDGYCERLKARALKILSRVAKMKKLSLPELAGQIVWDSESDPIKE